MLLPVNTKLDCSTDIGSGFNIEGSIDQGSPMAKIRHAAALATLCLTGNARSAAPYYSGSKENIPGGLPPTISCCCTTCSSSGTAASKYKGTNAPEAAPSFFEIFD
jgi:hypothetical protein